MISGTELPSAECLWLVGFEAEDESLQESNGDRRIYTDSLKSWTVQAGRILRIVAWPGLGYVSGDSGLRQLNR